MKPTKIIVHCSDSNWGDTEVIRGWHLERGWRDIGYHFVILNGVIQARGTYSTTWDGKVESGRAPNVQGAHCKGENSDSLGICLIGKGGKFTPCQIIATKNLITKLCFNHTIEISAIYGHTDFDPNKECPEFDVAHWIAGWENGA